MEQDWGLVQPQGGVYSAHEDISKAFAYRCEGSVGNIWRTRILSPNTHGVKDLHWAYGRTGKQVPLTLPDDMWAWSESVYRDWAVRQFGPEVGEAAAAILAELDGEYPAPSGWEEDGPGEILRNRTPWTRQRREYAFVGKLEALRGRIVGAGNLERFDYWLKTMQALRLMGEYGCVRDDFERAMQRRDYDRALEQRITMARLFERLMTLEVEKASNASDLGEIIHLELVNWKQLMIDRWDALLADGLGRPIPPEANPSKVYSGSPRVKVTPARTHVGAGESLALRVLVPGKPDSVILRYRPLGRGTYTDIRVTHVGRGVYKVEIPQQDDDFEYYVEARTANVTARFPVTAPIINQTVVIMPRAVEQKPTRPAE